jgi:hypothetical protein
VCVYILDVQNHHKNPNEACEIIQQINDKRLVRSHTELIFPTKQICKEAQDAANKLQFSDKSGFYFDVISDSLEIRFEDIRNESWLFDEVNICLPIRFHYSRAWKRFAQRSRLIFRSEALLKVQKIH